MAKIVLVLYDDPVDGYPKSYARDDIPKITKYPDGQTTPTPSAIDFKPGELLGSVSGELGLRKFLEKAGHTLVVTSDKDGANSKLDQELADAEIVISQPFWPAYMTAERIAKAPKLKMIVTAGIGSDHTDLQAAMDRGITVAEVTYCNSQQRRRACGDADPRARAQLHPLLQLGDQRRLEHRRLRVALIRPGRHARRHRGRRPHRPARAAPLEALRRPPALHGPPSRCRKRWRRSSTSPTTTAVESLAKVCDVVTLNCPLHPETEHMINDKTLKNFKRGAYLVNTARGKLCDRDAIVRALESGQLAGYAGDVWFPQPAPQDHPWRTMPHHGMTPHISGTSLSAQARYAAGMREILECYFAGKPIRNEYLSCRAASWRASARTPTAPAMLRAARRKPRSSRREREETPRRRASGPAPPPRHGG